MSGDDISSDIVTRKKLDEMTFFALCQSFGKSVESHNIVHEKRVHSPYTSLVASGPLPTLTEAQPVGLLYVPAVYSLHI